MRGTQGRLPAGHVPPCDAKQVLSTMCLQGPAVFNTQSMQFTRGPFGSSVGRKLGADVGEEVCSMVGDGVGGVVGATVGDGGPGSSPHSSNGRPSHISWKKHNSSAASRSWSVRSIQSTSLLSGGSSSSHRFSFHPKTLQNICSPWWYSKQRNG